jgi:8-oxo-dGTP pyrophosphatase MutT (NUDIX family)
VSGPGAADVPTWLRPLAEAAEHVRPEDLSRFVPPPGEPVRHSAVLVLFGEGPEGPDLLLTQRATTLRSHAGQPAFPGGSADPADGSAARTALREAAEEVGLDPAGVRVLAELPDLWLPPSGFAVTPVLAWWHSPSPVHVADPREVASVTRVPLAELVDPARRWRVTHPSGYTGPAFDVRGMLVWGFTAGLLDRLLQIGGLARPWDATRVRPLPEEALWLAQRTTRRAAEPPEPATVRAQAAGAEAAGSGGGQALLRTGEPDPRRQAR